MLINITMKTPDAYSDAVEDAISTMFLDSTLGQDDLERAMEAERDKVYSLLSRWFSYQEYLTVEVDTADQTIRVVPNK